MSLAGAITSLTVDTAQLVAELHALAAFTEGPAAVGDDVAVTRIVFTPTDLAARAYVESLAAELGLSVRHDAIGNTFFRWQGTEATLAPIATGSHIDAIPNAGMYDGTVGVLGGLAAIRALMGCGFMPQRSIDVILFTSEEPTRFGIGCLGSRMLGGVLAPADATKLTGKDGLGLDEARTQAGFSGDLHTVRLDHGAYDAFVELHIEQGPILEREQIAIGIVAAIAAPASLRLVITGQGGHAGAMLMPIRHDALTAAAEIILAVEAAALGTGAVDTVATVGICEVFPGAINSVPSRVTLSLDVRDIDIARRDDVLAEITAVCERVAKARGVTIMTEPINADSPAACDSRLLEAITEACAAEGLTSQRMVSRAYHDSTFMARIAPIAMIFIPCRNGVSHRPDEYSSPKDIGRGVAVLARTLATLSAQSRR
jgi:N-carbamoyl-L-amino-acid hydrolase